MNKLITAFIFFISSNVLALELIDKSSVENVGTIHSVVFDDYHSITVYLPEGYSKNNTKYPVMYVVDGERYFLHSIAYQKTLTWQEKVPAFIVVGINTQKMNRKEQLGDKSLEFIDTLENQVIAYIEKKYRTNDIRMYFGWEKAGGLALELFVKQPKLFDAYFLASSTHFTQERLDNVNKVIKANIATPRFFYYTLGNVESWSLNSHNALSKIFTNNSKSNFKWEFYLSKEGDHYTTPFETFNKGLSHYFSDYSPIRFYSIKEFEDSGGMQALKAHYKKRGDHYQISTDIHDDTKHYLLNQSINEGNFIFFQMLVGEFDGFIDSFNYSYGFITKIGQFYVDNGAINDAIALYESELMKNQKSKKLRAELVRVKQKYQQ